MGMPVAELTTIGRKSGQARTTMLTSPYQEGDQTIIVASRGEMIGTRLVPQP